MFYNIWIIKQTLMHTCHGILFSNKKEWITDTWHNTNEPPEIMLSLKSYRKRVLDDYLYEKIQEYIHFGYGECGAGID